MGGESVLITRRIPEAGLEALREAGVAHEVLAEEDSPTRREIMEGVSGRAGVIAMVTDPMDADVLAAAGPSLRVVSNYGVGFNNVDLDAATARNIAVTNTPGVLTDATADLAWALIMAVARRVGEGERMVREGRFKGLGPMILLGTELRGRTLGIVGAGRIGTAVAMRSRGWGMNVIYTANHQNGEIDGELGGRRVDLDVLCRESDVISVHVPLTPATEGMFNAERFAQMKRTALFINTARGKVHDEEALASALREGRIAGAGLDVYEEEPRVHPSLLALDSAVLLPHIGSGTIQTRERMAVMAAQNLIDVLAGRRPKNLVNAGVWRD